MDEPQRTAINDVVVEALSTAPTSTLIMLIGSAELIFEFGEAIGAISKLPGESERARLDRCSAAVKAIAMLVCAEIDRRVPSQQPTKLPH